MSTSGSTRSPVFRFFCASTRNSQGAASGRFFTKASRLGSSRLARRTASTSASRSGRWQSESRPPSFSSRNAHLQTSSSVQSVSWRAVARALFPCREIGRVAGAQVVAALALPEGAQVGADGRDVLNALFGAGGGQQRAGFGLQLQPQAGAAVALVVPFQAHDAAAGAQVGGAPGPLWLRKPGQQQREPKRCTAEQ